MDQNLSQDIHSDDQKSLDIITEKVSIKKPKEASALDTSSDELKAQEVEVVESEPDEQGSIIEKENPDSQMPLEDEGAFLEQDKKKSWFKKFGSWIVAHKKGLILTFLILFILGATSLAVAASWLIVQYNEITDIKAKATAITEGSIVYDRNDQELFRFVDASQKREIVNITVIPEEMKGAIIALEDENFYDNQAGIPWSNLAGASIKCFLSAGGECRGGSGLSQQLMKNVTGDDARTPRRKITELLTAIKFNQEIGETEDQKQDAVLELYLNWVPFGRNNYGVQSASKSYFAKDINKDLSIPQACYLASMVQQPSSFSDAIRLDLANQKNPQNPLPNAKFEQLQDRKDICIQKMFDLNLKNRGTEKFIQTQQEADALKLEKVVFQDVPVETQIYGHIKDYLTGELSTKLNINEKDLATGGYKIYTTFDKAIQDQTQAIITRSVDSKIVPAGGNNASSLIMEGDTAGVVAMIGSKDFNNEAIAGQVNVTLAPRQPGSSFKPYDYAAAFNNGFNPGTVLLDVSTDFGAYRPANFSRTTSGATTIRTALANSLNIPAVKAAYLSQNGGTTANAQTATANVISFSKKTGVQLPFENQCTISIVLGSCEVSMLSHVTGYNTLLHEGTYRAANPFRKIIGKGNFDILDSQRKINDPYPTQAQAIDPAIANQITNVMSDYNARSNSVWGACKRNFELDGWTGDNQVAAKSGTTENVKDIWAMGGSPYYTVGVWAGNTDGKVMKQNAGSCITAEMWKEIMTVIHQNLPKKGFSRDGLQRVNLDPRTGLLSTAGGTAEWLTQAQISALQNADKNLSNPDYDPLSNSIFQNRTPIINRKLKVMISDGKLAPSQEEIEKLKIPQEAIKEIECRAVISEFPQNSNWFEPAKAYAATLKEDFTPCPTEKSDLTKIGPVVTTNLKANSPTPGIITITAKSQISTATITEISFNLGGEEIDNVKDLEELEVDVKKEKLKGVKDVIIKVTDSTGLTTTVEILQVDFDTIASSSSSSTSSKANSSAGSATSSTSSSRATSSATSSSVAASSGSSSS